MTFTEISCVSLGGVGGGEVARHSSTLSWSWQQLTCAFFEGPFEGSRKTRIEVWVRGRSGWERSKSVKAGDWPHWNPVLHFDGARLWLFFKVGIYPKRWKTYVTTCGPDREWETPRELVLGDVGGRGPVKNKILVLQNGDWLAPASLERDSGWSCFVDRSRDGGATWEAGPLIEAMSAGRTGAGVIQPSLWESEEGQVHMLMRSDMGAVYRADSEDGGETWSEARPTALPNNNSGLDLIRRDRRLILACNPHGDVHGPRSPLTLLESEDNGETWREMFELESGLGEFSYPALIESEQGFVVSYTDCRRAIKVREFQDA